MLLFDFECPDCGNVFEELVHKEKMEYLYSNTAFPQTAGG
jgi:hypothetical protein